MNTDVLTIQECKWGVLITFPIKTSLLIALFRFYKKNYGLDVIDGKIGQKFDCLCLTCDHSSAQWRKELGIIDEQRKN